MRKAVRAGICGRGILSNGRTAGEEQSEKQRPRNTSMEKPSVYNRTSKRHEWA
jgi:hypothetical protein